MQKKLSLKFTQKFLKLFKQQGIYKMFLLVDLSTYYIRNITLTR